MDNFKGLEQKITRDLAVELSEEFDRNFERKAFFTEKWEEPKISNGRGSMMNRTGNLRRSIRYNIRDNMITFSSSLPYASIHNKGGELEVTARMKKYFWAMYYKATGAIKSTSKGEVSKSKRNLALTAEAQKWKNLALMKVGHKMKIAKRQIVGNHPKVVKVVKSVIDENIKLYSAQQILKFKR